jgi:hypothetical protein
MNKVRADYDLLHGRGSFDKAQQNIQNWKIQDGQYVLPKMDKNGNPVVDANGKPVVTAMMSQDEGNNWILRTNAARIAQGQPQLPVAIPVPGSNPKSTQPPGSVGNPYQPKTPLEARALPPGSVLIDPTTGQTVRVKSKQPGSQQPAGDSAASTQSTDTTDSGAGNLGDEELANEATGDTTTSASPDTDLEDQIAQDKAKRDLYA